MPIRFACEHCGARLSVSSRKAGARAKCPKCQEPIAVPAPEEDEQPSDAAQEELEADEPTGQQEHEDPFSQFVVYDDETELVYATEDEEETPYAEDVPVDPTKVAVPRRILYMQGALLGVVAVVCFVLGVIVGMGTSGPSGDDVAQECFISGKIALGNGGDTSTPDEGAVAIVVPKNEHPEQKADIDGLRPQDPQPDEEHPGLQAIRSIGGDYTRADENGRFRLRVRDKGEYFLFVISANRTRSDDMQPNDLAQIGRFFQLISQLTPDLPDLLGGNDYRWQEETIRRDRELNFLF
ncbi:MAG: hypothetical protein ISR77_05410 [Pirellulaceae bacterium]|nr:hypothetical protein [Pirellulaceae bacterium]